MGNLSRLAKALGRAQADLAARNVRFALIGGLAVSARTEPRFTRDLDLAVAVNDDAGAEAVVRGLIEIGYTPMTVLEQTATHRLATVRMLPPAEEAPGPVVDLLFASSGIEPEIVGAATPLEVFPAVILPVATVGHLIAMKSLSRSERRPQDTLDLFGLLALATPEDLAMAREAVLLIQQRGFNRGRDLEAELARSIRDAAI